MSGENIYQRSTASLIVWVSSLILLTILLLELGFMTSIDEVVSNWPAHITIVAILLVLEIVPWLTGRKSQPVKPS
ncbi:hypothetical protein [Desulfurococcus amylolyticus]|uniref:hypothetical protein n=1 Tax=Desulfurococcus amylolyticus TaxID=94694 RepID=UPI0005B1E9D1|nr:hypothetical protein [Desulfurococcus amylolyticus]